MPIPETCVYPQFNALSPDAGHEVCQQVPNGMYEQGCGMDALKVFTYRIPAVGSLLKSLLLMA